MSKLVVRVPNWIGDCVMALPALQLLHTNGIDLCILGRGWTTSLLRSLDASITTLAAGQGPGSQQLKELKQQGAKAALLMTHSCSSAAMAKRAGLPAIGFAKDWRGPLLTKRLPWPRESHEVLRYWTLAEAALAWMGQPSEVTRMEDWQPPWCKLEPSLEHLQAGAAAFAHAGLSSDNQTTLICPVATGTVKGMDKQWPGFKDFAHLWQNDPATGATPLAVIAPPGKEAELREQFPALPLLSNLTMDAFIGILAQAKLVIANDSGPMHIACAMGTRCLVPFGTGITYPERTGAWSPQLIPLTGGDPWPSAVQSLEAILSLPVNE